MDNVLWFVVLLIMIPVGVTFLVSLYRQKGNFKEAINDLLDGSLTADLAKEKKEAELYKRRMSRLFKIKRG